MKKYEFDRDLQNGDMEIRRFYLIKDCTIIARSFPSFIIL